jgi:hypothetical protein
MPRTSGQPGLGPPTAAQIEALFTAANQIFKGTGSHTGALQDFGTVLGSQFGAKGSLEAGTGSGTAAQLAVGSNTQVLTADSTQTTGLKWAAPAAGGGGVLADLSYTDNSDTSYTSGSGAMTAVDTTNLRLAGVIVPASGNIIFRATATWVAVPTGGYSGCLIAGTTYGMGLWFGAAAGYMRSTISILITGLTPAASVNLDLAYASGTSPAVIYCGPTYGPIVLEAWSG